MRTNKLQNMRPEEVLAAKQEKSLVYLPIGPLEWHSYHLPLGTDALMAENTAWGAAERTGGVMMPTLFLGTERYRKPEFLADLGFEDTDQYIRGMDFPKNTMKSFYAREDVFALTLREYLRLLVEQEYKLIVIVNAHAADGQLEMIEKLSREFSGETASRVITYTAFIPMWDNGNDAGHATILETAEMMAVNEANVDLSKLPPKGVPLKFTDFGMIDPGTAYPEKVVLGDPREATPEQGRAYLENCVSQLASLVEREYAALL